jgi:DNA end-binding protein Ku
MSTRERICGIELEEAGLRLTTLRTAEEVRDMQEMSAPPLPKADPQMLAIAEKIVEQQAGEFDPAEFVDRYEDALRDLIEEKKNGHVIKPVHVANDDTKVIDLMVALRNSLKAGSGADRPAKAAASDRRREPSRRGPAVKPRPRGGRHAACPTHTRR